MKAKSIFLALTGLFIAAGASAQPTSAPPDHAPTPHQHRATLDKDGDGAVSREEAQDKKRLSAHFDAIDGNKDGKLSKEEMQTFHAAMHKKHKAAFDQRFKEADKDSDGALSKPEVENAKMPGLSAHFDKADANQDGKISKDELHSSRRRMHDQLAARFKAADKDGDGALTKSEAENAKLERLVQHFDQIDSNKDGKIEPEEAHAKKGRSPAKAH